MKTFNQCLEEGLFGSWGKPQQQQQPQQTRYQQPQVQRAPQPANFQQFLAQFAEAPYHINPYDLRAIMANPRDREALDRISSRDRYVATMIQKFIQSGGQDQGHEAPTWGNDDYWGGRK